MSDLATRKCKPCEGGVEPYSSDEAKAQLAKLSGWRLTHDEKRIRKDWVMKHFKAAQEFLNAVKEVLAGEFALSKQVVPFLVELIRRVGNVTQENRLTRRALGLATYGMRQEAERFFAE